MKKIRVYGANWCPTTRQTLAYLDEKGIEYQYINIEEDEGASQWVKKQNHGKEIKPTLDIDGRVLSEPTEEELDDALAA